MDLPKITLINAGKMFCQNLAFICIYIIECSMPPLSEEATFQFSSPTQFQQTERKKKHIDLPLAA